MKSGLSTGEIIAAGPWSPLPLTDMYLSVTDRLVVGRQDGSIEVRVIGDPFTVGTVPWGEFQEST